MTTTSVRVWGLLAFLAPVIFVMAVIAIGRVTNPTFPVAIADVYIFALVLASIVFAFRIPGFSGPDKVVWLVILLAFHAFAVPVFWWLYIRGSANE